MPAPGAVVVAALVVLSLLGAGCTVDRSAPTATQVSDWMTTSGDGAAIGQVEVDSRNVDLALSRHDPSAAIRTVCALLTTDAQTAIGNLPTPDSQLTDDLNQAYEDAAAGRVFIKALRDIAPGKELNYDYGLVLDARHTAKIKKEYECRCGSPRCRGTMLSPKR